ncbi:hypothetical protein VX159_02775 [Dechloromonas sp. ZY10]|uniref:hypothetical protein n=1 Tax=Dechloromonas aquae TaxID=2664436 RepID=UPI003529A08C
MLSEVAKKSLNEIVAAAVRDALPLAPSDRLRIECLPASELHEPEAGDLLAQLIGSFSFRLLTVLHLDAAAEELVQAGQRCCQRIGDYLQGHFHGVGVARPQWQQTGLAALVERLRPAHVVQHRVWINDRVVMHASLCVNPYAPLHFEHRAAA